MIHIVVALLNILKNIPGRHYPDLTCPYLYVSVAETNLHSYATLSIPSSNSDFVEKNTKTNIVQTISMIYPYSIQLHQNQYMSIYRLMVVRKRKLIKSNCFRESQPEMGASCWAVQGQASE